jgi:DNA transposition AAA+ family ATPase
MPVMNSVGEAGFIETRQYRRFQEFCDACRRYQYIGLCYGPPGVGKTLSAGHYANWDKVERYRPDAPNGTVTLEDVKGSAVILYTPPVVVTSPGRLPNDIDRLRGLLRGFFLEEIRREAQPGLDAAQERLDALYEPLRRGLNMYAEPPDEVVRRQDAWRKLSEALSERIRAQPDPTALILIDEADRLKMTGLEQMRAIFDDGGIGMVLIGMPGLEKQLARYPQLFSRIGFVHEFKPLSMAEVRQLLQEKWCPAHASLPDDGIVDEESIAAIIRITGGNFRLLHRLLTQVGRVLEINGLEVITRPVVEAARESLVIGAA